MPFLFLLCLSAFFSGCTPVSYPGDKLKEAIADIAKKEYGINQCEVEINGATLGVFLPLKQLFAADFKEAILGGKVTNMEELFQPTEESIDKVEDMLFSMSRVILSTDRKIEFYYLQATDTEKTGMEITFLGNVDDVKKVRFWDIPRSEYRKRIIHEIQLNRAVLWDGPVRKFFRDLEEKKRSEIQAAYFKNTAEEKWAKEFFFTDAGGSVTERGQARWEILELRSLPVQDTETMVYAKVRVAPRNNAASAQTLEYLFLIAPQGDQERIRRIIPMLVMDQISQTSLVPLTKNLIYDSLGQWDREFKTPDITMGEFLARQLSRRIQQMVAEDERIANTFTGVKLILKFANEDPKHFSLLLTAPRKGFDPQLSSGSGEVHEDIIYLWELAAREFADVLRNYGFRDWQYLEFGLVQVQGNLWRASREDLDLFRKKKKVLQDILSLTRSN